jgi:hypothetical protein
MLHTRLKVGMTVRCPPDRGDQGYSGNVKSVGTHINRNSVGSDYVWVEVEHPRGTKHIWPSTRLG